MAKKKMKNPFKVGDAVRYKDNDPRIFYVYDVYSPKEVSLSLAGYPDVEQDFTTNIKDIKKVKGKRKLKKVV